MSYGAYFATQPSTRTYIDTSQPLNGFGDASGDGLLAIYDGVAGLGAAPSPGCGCAGTRGRLSGFRGFGDEVMPDGTTGGGLTVGVTQGTNIQTALVALLVVGSVAAVGYYLLAGKKAMRANGRRKRRGARMRRNGSFRSRAGKKLKGRRVRTGHQGSTSKTHVRFQNALGQSGGRVGRSYDWVDGAHESYLSGKGNTSIAQVEKGSRSWAAYIKSSKGMMLVGKRPTREAAKRMITSRFLSAGEMRRNGAPAYLLQKKGKTTERQARAAGHYLAETRWHGGPKRVARWSGKHLAHKRFNTNGKATPYGGHASISAYQRALKDDLVLVAQEDAMKFRRTMKTVYLEEQEQRGHALSRTQKRAIAHEIASESAHGRGISKPADRKVYMATFLRTVVGPSGKRRKKVRYAGRVA